MTTSTKFWRIAAPAVLSAALTLVVLTMFARPAEAADPYWTHHGCRYDPDSISPISYRFFSVHADYEKALKDAEWRWDTTAAPGYFLEHSTSPDPEVNVIDGFYAAEWEGAWHFQCTSDWSYRGNEGKLDFNRRKLDDNDATYKRDVAIHELGHAYGLDHVSSGCRVMREAGIPDNCNVFVPTSDDVDGVIDRYPE